MGDDNNAAFGVVGDRTAAERDIAKTRPKGISVRIVACCSADRKCWRVILFGTSYVLLAVCFELYHFDLDDHAFGVCCVLL